MATLCNKCHGLVPDIHMGKHEGCDDHVKPEINFGNMTCIHGNRIGCCLECLQWENYNKNRK